MHRPQGTHQATAMHDRQTCLWIPFLESVVSPARVQHGLHLTGLNGDVQGSFQGPCDLLLHCGCQPRNGKAAFVMNEVRHGQLICFLQPVKALRVSVFACIAHTLSYAHQCWSSRILGNRCSQQQELYSHRHALRLSLAPMAHCHRVIDYNS